VSRLDQRSGAVPGSHHPRMPQPFVETLALQTTPFEQTVGPATADRSKCKPLALILAVGGQLLFQRRQLGER
jgi:hypothetical protein